MKEILVYLIKRCSACKIEKTLNGFYKSKNGKYGVTHQCKQCMKEYQIKNAEKIKARKKAYNDAHREEISAYNKAYKKTHEEEVRVRVRDKEYYEKNKERIHAQTKEYREANHEEILAKKKEYYENNRAEVLVKLKEYRESHKEEIAAYKKAWKVRNRARLKARHEERYANDISYKLAILLRTRLYCAYKNNQKTGSAVRDLGCTISELRKYLESKFYRHLKTREPMTWKNHGSGPGNWNIDHIIPLASLDLNVEEQRLKACHYTNLQPLWFEENMSKSNKLDWEIYGQCFTGVFGLKTRIARKIGSTPTRMVRRAYKRCGERKIERKAMEAVKDIIIG